MQFVERGGGIFNQGWHHSRCGEHILKNAAARGVVINNQYLNAGERKLVIWVWVRIRQSNRRVYREVEATAFSASLSTQILPPIILTSRVEIARECR